ncbi:MAG: glycosyltransferase [Actinomycetota bacterium]|nr:glycosyltransferase [Actinomycetota bacterium]
MPRIAVVVPCHNEESAIAKVVCSFREFLPDATIVVADNASTDDTAGRARDAGAIVLTESRLGKGMAVRRLLSDVEADCYIMVDGDGTYDAASAPEMARHVLEDGVDMVVAARVVPGSDRGGEYRRGHEFGNRVLSGIFSRLFGLEMKDTLSGYRAFSRRFVKSFPATPEGFEVEAELNAHAALLGVRITHVESTYVSRPLGSESKLSTYRDGIRILRRNLKLFRDARPLLAFSCLATPWLIAAAVLIGVPVVEYFTTGFVLRFPTLIAGVTCLLISTNLWVVGLILDRVARNRAEATRLAYLALHAPIESAHLRLPC